MDSGLPSVGRIGLARKGSDCTQASHATETTASLGRLNCQRLAHDGAATSDGLQIGHAATAGRGRGLVTRGGRQRSKGSGGGLFQERTHSLGLAEDGVHDCARLN